MRILYVTTIGITMTFFKQLIRELMDEGHTVDVICNEKDEKVPDCYREWNCKIYHHSCSRLPLAKGNLEAIGQIRNLVKENKYDIVHCHTPIAAMCTRLACRNLRKQGLKVIYTAHGFHFYKGAPKLNWLIYYPIEKICSKWTDVLITINHEDYDLAKSRMNAGKVEYVPGVGIDVNKFKNIVVDRKEKRKELGVPEEAFLLVSVGELNSNKNHEVIVRAVAELKNENIHYAIAGIGELESYLKDLCRKLGVENQVHLLGYRKDVAEIYKVADACCFPSIREGLGLAALEGLASRLPVVATVNRGTSEYIRNGINGIFATHDDFLAFGENIARLYGDRDCLKEMSKNAENSAIQYDVSIIIIRMKEIYFGTGK